MRRDKIHRHGEKETDDAETNHRFQALRRRWPFHLAEAHTHRRSLVAALLILLSTFYSYSSMLLLLTYVYICMCCMCVCEKSRVFLVRLFFLSSFCGFQHLHRLLKYELSSFKVSCRPFSRGCTKKKKKKRERERERKKKPPHPPNQTKKKKRREKGATKGRFLSRWHTRPPPPGRPSTVVKKYKKRKEGRKE